MEEEAISILTDINSIINSDKRGNSSQPNTKHMPSLKIIEEPGAQRFRYEREGRIAPLPGVNSKPDKKTYPTISIDNVVGAVMVIVSCVTAEQPYRPHPHRLEGDKCNKGICILKLEGDLPLIHKFESLGIQSVKRPDMEKSMNERMSMNINPFLTHISNLKEYLKKVDLYKLRLCFELYQNSNGIIKRLCKPIVSQVIYQNSLTITGICSCSAKAAGGDDIILLCNNISDTDIKIRFFEDPRHNNISWEDYGRFTAADIHKKVAIKFKTPPYWNQDIEHAVQVWIQLVRETDKTASEALPFEYKPNPERRSRKRPLTNMLENLIPNYNMRLKDEELVTNDQSTSLTPYLDDWILNGMTSDVSPVYSHQPYMNNYTNNLSPDAFNPSDASSSQRPAMNLSPAAFNPSDASSSKRPAMNLSPAFFSPTDASSSKRPAMNLSPTSFSPTDASTSQTPAMYTNNLPPASFSPSDASTSKAAAIHSTQPDMSPFSEYNTHSLPPFNSPAQQLTNQSFDNYQQDMSMNASFPLHFDTFNMNTNSNNYHYDQPQQQQQEQEQAQPLDTDMESLSDILKKIMQN